MAVVRVVRDPLLKVRQDVFQVLDAVIARLDGVVAQILLDGTRIVARHRLLPPVAVNGVAGLLVNPCLHHFRLFLGRQVAGHRAVQPFDDKIVVIAQLRRGQANTFIARLRHVVEARIVHDGGRRAVDRRERRRAQRVDRVRRRGRHVVHQSERVPNLVRHHVGDRLVHHVPRHFLRPHPRVHLRRLRETPIVD